MHTSISNRHRSAPGPYTDGIIALRPIDACWWLRATIVPTSIAVLLIAVLVLTVVLAFPRTYRSQAKLLLRLGRESVTLDPASAATGQMMQMHQTRENEIETALGVMSSRLLLEDVVDAVGVEAILKGKVIEPNTKVKSNNFAAANWIAGKFAAAKDLLGSIDPESDREKAIRMLEKKFSISADRDSSVVEIEYRTSSPQVAQQVVQRWMNTYVAKHGEFNRTPGTLAFFQQEQLRLTEQLANAHRLLREAKDDSGLLTVSGQQAIVEKEYGMVRESLNRVDTELSAGLSSVIELERQLSLLEDSAVIEQVYGSTASRDEMRARVFDLQLAEKDLASRYTKDHPKMAMTQRQLEETRRVLAEQDDQKDQVVRGINPTYQRIETELAMQRATTEPLIKRRDTIQGQLKKLSEEVQFINGRAEKIAVLEREIAVLESQYVTHSERLDQARLEEVLQKEHITSVREIQPATFESRPVSPNKVLCFAFGGLAMLSAACGIPLWLGPGRVHRTAGVLPKTKASSYKDWERLSEYEDFDLANSKNTKAKIRSGSDQGSGQHDDDECSSISNGTFSEEPSKREPVDVRDDR